MVYASAARRDRDDPQRNLGRGGAHVDLSHRPPPGSPRAAKHDGLPDSNHRLTDVLVAVPDGTERSDAIRCPQCRSDGRSPEASAAVDSEHQHRLHRARRSDIRSALYSDARERVENRYPAAIRGVTASDSVRLFHSHTWDQTGGRRWKERVHLAVPELRAAEHR